MENSYSPTSQPSAYVANTPDLNNKSDTHFWVKWMDANNCEVIVGVLSHTNGTYYFRYNKEFLNTDMIPNGFNGVPSFGQLLGLSESELKGKLLRVYCSEKLFNFFKMRIAKETDRQIWEKYGLTEYDECKLLKISKALLPTDSFFVEEMGQNEVADVKNYYAC